MRPDLKEIVSLATPLIAGFEGCRLHAYRDAVGVWTIGYGHTDNVRSTDSITQEQAEAILMHDIEDRLKVLLPWIKADLTAGQVAAVLSLAFNVGLGAVHHSHLLTLINSGFLREAADGFEAWCHAGGRVLPGLVRRRAEEKALFLKGMT
jgi:lysozyme